MSSSACWRPPAARIVMAVMESGARVVITTPWPSIIFKMASSRPGLQNLYPEFSEIRKCWGKVVVYWSYMASLWWGSCCDAYSPPQSGCQRHDLLANVHCKCLCCFPVMMIVIHLTQMAGSDLRCCFCFLNRGMRSRHYNSGAIVGGKHGFIIDIVQWSPAYVGCGPWRGMTWCNQELPIKEAIYACVRLE